MKIIELFAKKYCCTHNNNYKRLTFLTVIVIMTAMVVTKSCSYDGIDVDVDGGDRKRKVHC